MSIEPNDLINKNFKKKIFGGYDAKDVTRLLHTVAKEIELLREQNDNLLEELLENKKRLDQFERLEEKMIDSINSAEHAKKIALREVEKQADTIIATAKQRAEFILKEAEERADNAMQEAKKRYSNDMDKLRKDTKMMKRDYQAIDNYSDKLLNALSEMAEKTLSEARRLQAIKDMAHADQASVKIQKEKTKELNERVSLDPSTETSFFEDLNLVESK
ncbi:DivIVA domain-containing protein [Flammeovirga sp. MY04]|uniref:DivIVA domain-containing protein n=1 Tax=Flammeovirga sp. MY04 TaxID=1191459 RepID=UPI0008063F87|nr:DivIVA domain-containing protein [Flammeovirga sp. MY04]ANQ47524.1 DivIVA domain-containing protein [Flammeovirga sp. MY04]